MKDIKTITGVVGFNVGLKLEPLFDKPVSPGDFREQARRQDIRCKVQQFAHEAIKELREQLDKLIDGQR